MKVAHRFRRIALRGGWTVTHRVRAVLTNRRILLATGGITVVLLFVLTAALALPTTYIWSRLVEGRRAATDRLVTLAILTAFGIALAPLISLLWEVINRGATDYRPLVVEIVKFFQTGKPPVSPEETLEIFAFMDAAQKSKEQGGKPIRVQ